MGTNTLTTTGISSGSTVEASNVTQFYTAFDGDLVPRSSGTATSNSGSLGTSTYMWSDVFLASGAVVNFNNSDITLTHSSDTLTLSNGSANAAFIMDGYITTKKGDVTLAAGPSNEDLITSFETDATYMCLCHRGSDSSSYIISYAHHDGTTLTINEVAKTFSGVSFYSNSNNLALRNTNGSTRPARYTILRIR